MTLPKFTFATLSHIITGLVLALALIWVAKWSWVKLSDSLPQSRMAELEHRQALVEQRQRRVEEVILLGAPVEALLAQLQKPPTPAATEP
jgi:hypothetical protein